MLLALYTRGFLIESLGNGLGNVIDSKDIDYLTDLAVGDG